MTTTIKLEDGKYTVIHDDGTNLRALRHGEPWRDLVGDGLVLAMAQRIEQLEASHDPMYQMIEQFGTAVTDMFDQFIKSGWSDDHGHDVKMNASMIALKKTVEDAIALRAALANTGSPAKPDSTKERADACVAACASIPTYLLFGKNREPNDLGAMIVILRKQRNDLVDALGKIADFAPGNGDVCEIIAKISRAALTKVGAA